MVDGRKGDRLISIGFYEGYVSFIGLTLCRVSIYNISIYGLVKNKLWGLFSTTFIAFYIVIMRIRNILWNDAYTLSTQLFIFLAIFIYLTSIIINKAKKYLDE